MNTMKRKATSSVLVPIISIFLFVTIVTASPTTVTGDLNTNQIQNPAVSSPANTNVTKAPTLAPVSGDVTVPAPAPAKTSTPTTSTKQAQPQTSRSESTSSSATANPSTSPNTTSQAGKVSTIIATSKQYLGVPYLYGGTTPAGFDCSGFVQYVFAKNGITLPRVSRDQYKVGTSVSYSNLRPGDLVFFSLAKNGVVDHEGIYVGNGQFINAASSKGVTIYTLGSYWNSVYIGAKRII